MRSSSKPSGPIGSSVLNPDLGNPTSNSIRQRYGVDFNQGVGAEMMAAKWGFTRWQLDEFASQSHERLVEAIDTGRLQQQIAPVTLADGSVFSIDEGLRRGTTPEKLGGLKPAFVEDGLIHAGNSSQISDGAAALLLTTSEKAQELGLAPIARVHTAVVAGDDPVMMLSAPIPAHRQGAREVWTLDRRDRRLRGQRGLRAGADGVAGRDGRQPQAAQPQRRRDRDRPPARRFRRPPDDHSRPPHGRQREACTASRLCAKSSSLNRGLLERQSVESNGIGAQRTGPGSPAQRRIRHDGDAQRW